MPMRTNVGSGDGVTNASIRPDTSSTPTSPTATATTARPCSASTCPRGRLPGDTTDQPSRIPDGGGKEHRRQFEQPVRGEQAQEDVGLARVEHEPRDHPEIERVLEQQPRDRDAEQDREADALHCDPRVVHPHLQCERPSGVLAVVGREVVVDQFLDLAWGFEAGLQFVVAGHPQGDQHGHEEERHGRAEPPPPGPVGDHRERHRPKPDELTPQRRVGTGHRRTRLRHQAGQPPDEDRIGRCGPHHRQVRRHALVEVDKLVDLRASQPPTPLHQRLEPVPRRAMRQHERVDIHMANPSSVS